MNHTTRLEIRPEVAHFVERVRARLSDLSEEEREELLGGLEADLTELVDDRGSVAGLGDPDAYADELRTAAGLEQRAAQRRPRRPRRPRQSWRQLLAGLLDGSHARWESLMRSRGWLSSAWDVVVLLRPSWWVLRGWVAAQLVDWVVGPWESATLVPRMGDPVSGWVVLLVAVVGSVLLGLGRAWPASHATTSLVARTVLAALNVFAVVQLALVVDQFPSASYLHEQAHPCSVGRCGYVPDHGLVNDGRAVRNVFAYDVNGDPVEGVQLFDQAGRPLAVDRPWVTTMRYAGEVRTLYPWAGTQGRRWNVFPLPVHDDARGRLRADVWTSDRPPYLPQPPLVVVPPVSLDWEDRPGLG